MRYYWEILERDGTITKIPPDSVTVVQRRWTEGLPIHTETRSIPANQIQSFHVTADIYGGVPMLEAASQAFSEPMITDDGSVKWRWVKQVVTSNKWGKYYSLSPGYKLLRSDGGIVEMAFKKAIHDIDVNKTPYLTDEEVKAIEYA